MPPKRGPSLRARPGSHAAVPEQPPPPTVDLHSFYRGTPYQDPPPVVHQPPPVSQQVPLARPPSLQAQRRSARPPVQRPPQPRPGMQAGPRRVRWDRLRLVFVYPVLAAALYGLLFNPAMRVSQMVALGADFSETELDDHFNWSDWQGRYIWALWVNRGPLLRLLNDHPRVERATVRFILPGRLEVTFQPKERYAAFISGGRAFWVAQDFTFCGLEPADRVAATRTMTGLSPGFLFAPDGTPLDDPFPEWPPLPGGSAVNQGRYYYHQLLRLWRWMDHETNPAESLVDHLELNKDRGIILHYRTGQNQPHPPILLGWGPELERKYGQALTVYRSGRWWGATGIEIDLSSNRNVVRTIHDPVPLDAADAGDSPTLAPADEARALGDPKGRSLSEFRVPMAPPFAPSAE